MEADCVKELEEVIENVGDDLSEFDELFKDCVETEVKFYRWAITATVFFLFDDVFKDKYGLRASASKTSIICTEWIRL